MTRAILGWMLMSVMFFSAFAFGGPPLPDYDMLLEFGSDLESLTIGGELVIPAAADPRTSVRIGLSEAFEGLAVQVLRPEPARTGELVEAEPFPGPRDGWGTRVYVIEFAAPVPAGQEVVVRFSATGKPGAAFLYNLGSPVSFGAGICTAWYPQVEDTRSDQGDWSGLRGSGTLRFMVPEDYVVYTAGTSSLPLERAREFRFESPIYFSYSIARYIVAEGEGRVPTVACYLGDRPDGKEYLDRTTEILGLLSETFGDYPHHRFGLVEVPTVLANEAGFGGASLEGMILASSQFLDQDYSFAYFGHEMGHQWWGNMVSASGSEGSMMISEGMAQYGALVTVEALQGQEAAQAFRSRGLPGYSSVQSSGFGYLRLNAADQDPSVTEASDGSAARMVGYSKGFLVMSMLADEVGADNLHQALQQVIDRRKYAPVSWEDFRADLAEFLERDLDWFFEQWCDRRGAPEPELTWSQGDEGLEVTVRQPERAYRMHLEVAVDFASGLREIHRILVADDRTNVVIPVTGRVARVTLDPQDRILRWTPELKEETAALKAAMIGKLAVWRGDHEEALQVLTADLEDLATSGTPDIHGRRFATEATLGQMFAEQGKFAEARDHLLAALQAPVRRPDELPWVYFFLGMSALELEDASLLAAAQDAIVSADAIAVSSGAPEALAELVNGAANP